MEALVIAQQQIAVKDEVGARRTLVTLLREEPDNLEAWLLLAPLLSDPAQQAECYRRVLRLEPHHLRATALLSEVSRRLPASPSQVTTTPPAARRQATPSTNIPNPFAEGEDQDEIVTIENEPEIPDEILTDLNEELNCPEPQDEQERALRDWVVRELLHYEGQNQIVRQICIRTGMDWHEAEKLVLRIAQHERHTIARKQAPLLIGLSIGTLIGGGAVVIYAYRPEGFLMILGGFIGLLRVWYTLKKR